MKPPLSSTCMWLIASTIDLRKVCFVEGINRYTRASLPAWADGQIEPSKYGGCGTARIEIYPKVDEAHALFGALFENDCPNQVPSWELRGLFVLLYESRIACFESPWNAVRWRLEITLGVDQSLTVWFTCLSHLVVQPSNKEKSKAGGG
jgi:hypothetical protein